MMLSCYSCKFNVNKEACIFKAWLRFRKVFHRIVEHRFFEWFILVIILASTVSLVSFSGCSLINLLSTVIVQLIWFILHCFKALEDVNLKNNPELELVLNILEYVFTCIFTLEMILKWIGIGWTKYFTDWWCIIDFVIVVVSTSTL